MFISKLAKYRPDPALEALLVFVLSFAGFFLMLANAPGVTEPDTLYHFKLAELIRLKGPWVDVIWLPYTVLGEIGPDHHWLWHLLLAPFTLIEDKLLGIKLASAFTCALIPAAFSLIGRRLGIPFSPLFALLSVFSGMHFPEHFLRLRTQDLSLIMMFLAMYALSAKRMILLAFTSFLFMQSYHGAIILLPITTIFIMLQLIRDKRLEMQPAFAVLAGLLLGLILSPWFPANLNYLLFHTLFKLSSQDALLIGGEWLSPDSHWLLMQTWHTHALLSLSIVLFMWNQWNRKHTCSVGMDTTLVALVTALFFFMYTKHARFSEYYAPFAVLCSGLLLRDTRLATENKLWRRAVVLGLSLFMAVGLYRGADFLLHANKWRPLSKYQEMVAHIEAKATPGEIVFNADWGDFVTLFWHSRNLRYVNGLDGNYLAFGDPERFRLFDQVVHGTAIASVIEGDVSRTVRDAFNTHWMIIPRRNMSLPLVNKLKSENGAELRIENKDGWLFYLRSD